jgi:hypothetical protein
MKINMEGRWNDSSRENSTHSKKNLPLSQFGHHKSLMNLPRVETGSPRDEVDN